MADVDKKKDNTSIWAIGTILLVFAVVAVFFLINSGNTTEELTIDGTESVSGIRCIDTANTNILLKDYSPVSYKNVITVSFTNERLASITYAYEGSYSSSAEADHARDFAESAYNSTMSKEYGLEITDFARNMSVNENTVYISITATDNKFLNSKTAPIFMLSSDQAFPSSLKEIETAYESAGFFCEVNN